MESSDAARSMLLPLMAIAAVMFFIASSIRHYVFKSGALDLGFFDQLVYLVSTGQRPISTLIPLHLLADHAAYNLYALAPLYRLWPDVHVLLAVQAIAFAAGAYPVFRLARLQNVSIAQSRALAIAYLLYPVLLVANLFDFHPEVLAVPALLFAVLAAERRHLPAFILALVVAAGGKEVISLTIAATGVWLLACRNRPLYGSVAIALGCCWFLFATRWLIPHFGSGREASGVGFFSYLGSTLPQIVVTLVFHPSRWLGQILRLRTVFYLVVLFVPVSWGLNPKRLWPLLCAVPMLTLNILARTNTTVDLTNPMSQYSLMVVPFIALALIDGVASGKTLLRNPRCMIAWSIAVILLGAGVRLARVGRAGNDDPHNGTVRAALAMIDSQGGVLTTHEIVPHLSERQVIQYISPEEPILPLDRFNYILIDYNQASIHNARQMADQLVTEAESSARFSTALDRDHVLLLIRVGK